MSGVDGRSDWIRGLGLLSGLVLWLACTSCASSPEPSFSARAVELVLDDWHAAASVADEERYFSHFAPDAIFLGTDAGERWTVDRFRAYAHPHFAEGGGWTYVPGDRRVMFSADGRVAWFDENLRNDKYGELRGTGVLDLRAGEWKLVHYSMSFTIPNRWSREVVELIRRETP